MARRRKKNPSTFTWVLIGAGALLGVMVLSRRAKAAKAAPAGARVKAKGGVVAEITAVVTGKEPEMEIEMPADAVINGKIKIDPSGHLLCVDPTTGAVIARGNCEPALSELSAFRHSQGLPA